MIVKIITPNPEVVSLSDCTNCSYIKLYDKLNPDVVEKVLITFYKNDLEITKTVEVHKGSEIYFMENGKTVDSLQI